MFAATQGGGVALGGPDACKTPPTQAPIPYPNIAVLQTASGFISNITFGGAPAHNLSTEVKFSNGDNAGVVGGAVSNKVMNKMTYVLGAVTVLVASKPTPRMTSPTKQNDGNCLGLVTIVANLKVLVLAP